MIELDAQVGVDYDSPLMERAGLLRGGLLLALVLSEGERGANGAQQKKRGGG